MKTLYFLHVYIRSKGESSPGSRTCASVDLRTAWPGDPGSMPRDGETLMLWDDHRIDRDENKDPVMTSCSNFPGPAVQRRTYVWLDRDTVEVVASIEEIWDDPLDVNELGRELVARGWVEGEDPPMPERS